MCGFYPINANRVQQWICSTKGGVKPLYPVGQELQGVCSNPNRSASACLKTKTAVQGDRLPSRFHTQLGAVQKSEEQPFRCKAAPTNPSSAG